ncbi:hypothetical protein EVAR_38684_1 [Eumeta japonica]|uniref:Uncharacterized protein n=1 Tax=Eumeta variegata TaxID=151549 RepID=A0A4C1YAP8_EUMVA|nr:hypothetical protein EVAR_38684_1 [Eumeta japonica]
MHWRGGVVIEREGMRERKERGGKRKVVFVSEKNNYIPVSIRPRSPGPGAGEPGWREPPAWEREYRRHRTNASRVQCMAISLQ